MTILITILTFIIFCAFIVVFLNMPGCTGNCQQGRYECDCTLRKDKDDFRQDKRP